MSGEIVMKISGKRLNNLRRAADAMNTVEWCERDNTPLTVFKNFVFAVADQYMSDTAQLTLMVLAVINTGRKYGTPEHDKRIAELRRAFEDAGLIGKGVYL